MKEIWKDIGIIKGIDYTGYYQISNKGRVRSLDRKVFRTIVNVYINLKGALIKQSIAAEYYFIWLYKNGSKKSYMVHRLIAQTFIPNPLSKPEVNHINGIKTDNNISNLEWVTSSENTRHAFHIGLIKTRKKVLMLSLTGIPLLWFNSISEASRMSGISRGNISSCCTGNRQITGGYRWQHY